MNTEDFEKLKSVCKYLKPFHVVEDAYGLCMKGGNFAATCCKENCPLIKNNNKNDNKQ